MFRAFFVMVALSFSMLSCGVGVEGEDPSLDPQAQLEAEKAQQALWFEIIVSSHTIKSPRDAASGTATGK